jgi:DNA-binding transcriptional MerR regulator
MTKSSQAFRTIREVAEWLDIAAHVLRFWESKFPQIKPVKRAGGRRYYRPSDMELVGGIKVLLHDRGLTIRGVQRMIRENGLAAVAALSPPLDLADVIEGDLSDDWIEDAARDAKAAEARTAEPAAMPAAPAPLMPAAQPSLALDLPVQVPPAPASASLAETAPSPASIANLSRLAALVADPAALPAGARAKLRPALVALCDRMRENPPA